MDRHGTHDVCADCDVDDRGDHEVGKPPPENLFVTQMVPDLSGLLLIGLGIQKDN